MYNKSQTKTPRLCDWAGRGHTMRYRELPTPAAALQMLGQQLAGWIDHRTRHKRRLARTLSEPIALDADGMRDWLGRDEAIRRDLADATDSEPRMPALVFECLDWPFSWELDRDDQGTPFMGPRFAEAFMRWQDQAEAGGSPDPTLPLVEALRDEILSRLAGPGQAELAAGHKRPTEAHAAIYRALWQAVQVDGRPHLEPAELRGAGNPGGKPGSAATLKSAIETLNGLRPGAPIVLRTGKGRATRYRLADDAPSPGELFSES